MPYASLRRSELGENATRYDWLLAQPSDDVLTDMWFWWIVASAISATSSFVMLVGLAAQRKTWEKTFHVLIIFLVFPDFVFSLLCCITCANNNTSGHWSGGDFQCEFQVQVFVDRPISNKSLTRILAHSYRRFTLFSAFQQVCG